MTDQFLHELADIKDLIEIVANEKRILPVIVEKDYWIMHCLWGMQQQGLKFDLKGGTSLSKAFEIIKRFSEDIDIQIYPKADHKVMLGKNQNKPAHIESRKNFFDDMAESLNISGLDFKRDHNFDDSKMRSGGVRGEYNSFFTSLGALKEGILLELGFDQTTPNIPCDISSWVFDKALSLKLSVIDNRAKQVSCYLPEYSFVEKLQAISTKYRLQQENKTMPVNFLRHYYDVYKLLENERVLSFIGSKEYIEHKQRRFRAGDELKISINQAFIIDDPVTRHLYNKEFKKKSSLYFGDQINFDNILKKISKYIDLL